MSQPSNPKRRQTNLETANEMWKAAFIVKKMRFAKENPQFTEEELMKFTANYFLNLSSGGTRGSGRAK